MTDSLFGNKPLLCSYSPRDQRKKGGFACGERELAEIEFVPVGPRKSRRFVIGLYV